MLNFGVMAAVILFIYIALGYKKPGVAILTVPFVAFALGFRGVLNERPEEILFAVVLVIITAVVVTVATYRSQSHEWYHRWAARTLIAIVFFLLLAAILIVFTFAGAGPVVPVFFFVGTAIFIAVLIGYNVTSRRAAITYVFSVIGSSMRQNLPLPMALDCAASGREDASTAALRRIKTWLVKGYSLAEAVRRGYPGCPRRMQALLSAGERINQLPAAVNAIQKDMAVRVAERAGLRPVHPFYPVVVLVIMFLLVSGMMTFVLPSYTQIWEEMFDAGKSSLPMATQTLIWLGRTAGRVLHPMLLLVLLALLWFGIGLRAAARNRASDKPSLSQRIADFLRWHLPVLHWFENNRCTLRVVEFLRMSLQADLPVNEAIRGALSLRLNACFRKRLARWLERVERGENIATAARACRLSATLAWAFDSDVGAGHTPAVLEMLESYHRSNYSYRVNLTRFILWPCVIIALGATVGFVVYACYSPCVALLQCMADQVYP